MTRHPRSSTTRWQKLYSSHRWRKASEDFRASPEGCLCLNCKTHGRIVATECVDHDPPHNGVEAAFWNRSTWVPLCWPCHSSKTRGDQVEARTGKVRLRPGADVRGFPTDRRHSWWQERGT